MNRNLGFVDSERPILPAGEYDVKVVQDVAALQAKHFEAELHLSVVGERFSLDAQAVHAVFPPMGSMGRHMNVLPHIAINRTTFPWERTAGNALPWVVLLLFDEREIAQGDVIQRTLTLESLDATFKGCSVKCDLPKLEIGQLPKDKVVVIDVKTRLLKAIMPTGETLKLLAHVRSLENTELAVVVGNRLPRAQAGSTAHLVSVEGRFKDGSFNFDNANDDHYIRLVSLKSWSFACTDSVGGTFIELVDALHAGPFGAPPTKGTNPDVGAYLFRGYVLLRHHMRQGDRTYSFYHGPLTTQEVAPELMAMNGYLPKSADELMRYHADIGLFDVAYAAAFELGRVLAMDSPVFASALYRWKHQRMTRLHREAQGTVIAEAERFKMSKAVREVVRLLQPRWGQLLSTQDEDELEKQEEKGCAEFKSLMQARMKGLGEGGVIQDILAYSSSEGRKEAESLVALLPWLEETAALKNIPFNYLVPDERLLPGPEPKCGEDDARSGAIRFFKVDLHWLESLFLGAFSIGQPMDSAVDRNHTMARMWRCLIGPLLASRSGVILRSPVVSGYPDLLVHGFADKQLTEPLSPFRCDRLAPDVLLVLFSGGLKGVSLSLNPVGMHYCAGSAVKVDEARTIVTAKPPSSSAAFARLMADSASLGRRFVMGDQA